MRRSVTRGALVASLFLFLGTPWIGCTKSGPTSPADELVARGRVVYQTNCIACHNTNPHKPGTLGPEIFGSALDLVEARVMRGQYPPGYTPKRQTHQMVPIPQLKADIPALHAFLNAKE